MYSLIIALCRIASSEDIECRVRVLDTYPTEAACLKDRGPDKSVPILNGEFMITYCSKAIPPKSK